MMTRLAGGLSVILLVGLVGCLMMWRPWAGSAEPPPPNSRKSPASEFAADRAPGPVDPVPFDAKRAMEYLSAICRIGPRISGTEGMARQQELLKKHFEHLGGRITFQKFVARQPSVRRPVDMA